MSANDPKRTWAPLSANRLRGYHGLVLTWGPMRRREFIAVFGGAAALPFAALAQRQTPLVGFLNSASPDTYRFNADSFREGLAKAGFVEGRPPVPARRLAGEHREKPCA